MRDKMKILLIEDDEVDVLGVKRAFKHNNITNPLYVVFDAEDGLDFLRHQGKYPDLNTAPRPNLILLDLKLPRMDGHEFLRIIKSDPQLREIPVVMLTSSEIYTDIKESYQNGVAGYLVKPVTFSNLVEMVRHLDLYWTLSELP